MRILRPNVEIKLERCVSATIIECDGGKKIFSLNGTEDVLCGPHFFESFIVLRLSRAALLLLL